MTDTHTHLYLPEFYEDIDSIISECINLGINCLILPNVDLESIPQAKLLHQKYPQVTHIAMGLHPTEVKENWEEVLDVMKEELENGKYVAVGEIGMDLYWDTSTLEIQKKAFEEQLKLAEKYQLPVIIHSRNACDETLEVIRKVKPTVPLIFHSFTAGVEDVRKIREIADAYFGINGVVTYKNAQSLRDALPEIGIERILLETDAPWLSPVPHRGKRNDSTKVTHVKDKIAEVLGLPSETVERITDQNAIKAFPTINK